MRPVSLCGGILGILLLTPAAPAEPATPFTFQARTITSAEVEVRSGPSSSYFATSKLKRGDVVKVVTNKKDVPEGWLAIQPPRGSFSWISYLYVQIQANQHDGIVLATEAAVLPGSTEDKRPPTVRSALLDRGAMVVILGPPLVTSDGSKWLPIEPHPTEVRYIPVSAVANVATLETVSAKTPAANPIPQTGAAAPPDSLWQQAYRAEAEGRLADADRLYRQLYAQSTDNAAKWDAYNRIVQIQKQLSASASGRAAPASTTSWNRQPNTAPATSLYGPTGGASQTSAPGGNYGPAPAPAPAPVPEQWSGAGMLRRTRFQVDGKQVYALENERSELICYVIPQPGINLDPEKYLNRRVNLYGPISYRGEAIRALYMSASYLQAQ